MIIEIIRPSLTNEDLQKRLDEIRRIAGIIVRDTYDNERAKDVQKHK